MKVVLAVDDSPHARAATDWVLAAKWPTGTTVTVVSAAMVVATAFVEAYAPPASYADRLFEQEFEHCRERVMEVERRLRDAGFHTEGRALEGDPREVIVAVARAEGADLVVLGSHGRTGVEKLLMGSVASHVVTHAPCSVLVVKLKDRGR